MIWLNGSNGWKGKARACRDKRRMLIDISHDLRTPMTTIQGYIEAMEVGLVDSERRQKSCI